MAFADVGKSGCCFANLSKKFWRTNLSLSAELIDAEKATIVWRGTGEAAHVNRGGGKSTYSGLGGLQVHHKNPKIASFLNELISVATSGVAREIAGRKRVISAR